MYVYADNAATTRISAAAKKAMDDMNENFWGNPSSLHTPGQKAAEQLWKARETMAAGLGCSPKEIYFTSGGSEADNQALVSAAVRGAKKGKKHIISTTIEHHAILNTLKSLKRQGFEVTLLDVDPDGYLDPARVAAAIRDDTALVSVMYANNEIGTIEPIEQIGALCHSRGVLFHTDAVQAAGHLAIDTQAQNIDMLSLSAHKFHGPRGVGLLYSKTGIDLTPVIYGGAQERNRRAGTENLPAIAGMAAAFTEMTGALDANAGKTAALRDRLIRALSEIPHSKINGSLDRRLPGNINVCFEGIEGESLLLLLDGEGIAASSGSACASGSLDPSHVLLAIGLPAEVAHGSLRLSLCESNTADEVDHIIDTVPRIVTYLRGMSPVWEELEKGERKHVI